MSNSIKIYPSSNFRGSAINSCLIYERRMIYNISTLHSESDSSGFLRCEFASHSQATLMSVRR